MTTLFGHLFHRMMTKGRIIGLIVLSSVTAVVIWLSSGIEGADADEIYPVTLITVGFTFAIAVLIVTVGTLRDEKDQGTLPYIYMRPIPRPGFAATSILTGAATAAVIGLGAWITSWLGAMAAGIGFSQVLPGLTMFAAASLGYAAVFVPLGYLAPRSLLFGLGYVVVLEQVVGYLITGVAQLSIWRIAASIYVDLAPATIPDEVIGAVLGPVTPGAMGGLVKIAVVMVLGWLVLTWALKERDAV